MLKCVGCNNTIKKDVHIIFDAEHKRVRVWCSFCRAWWSFKYKNNSDISVLKDYGFRIRQRRTEQLLLDNRLRNSSF